MLTVSALSQLESKAEETRCVVFRDVVSWIELHTREPTGREMKGSGNTHARAAV